MNRLRTFSTEEIIEIPNSGGNHASPFLTENTEYLMAATRFSVPIPQKSVALEESTKGALKGSISARNGSAISQTQQHGSPSIKPTSSILRNSPHPWAPSSPRMQPQKSSRKRNGRMAASG